MELAEFGARQDNLGLWIFHFHLESSWLNDGSIAESKCPCECCIAFIPVSWCNNGMFAIGQNRRLLEAKTPRPAGLNYGGTMLSFGQGSLFFFLYLSGSSLMYLGD